MVLSYYAYYEYYAYYVGGTGNKVFLPRKVISSDQASLLIYQDYSLTLTLNNMRKNQNKTLFFSVLLVLIYPFTLFSQISSDTDSLLQPETNSDQLHLRPKFTWLSIPRHDRPANNVTPIDTVFDPGNISGTLEEIRIEYNNINEDMGAGEQLIISSEWDYEELWDIHEDNSHVYSTRGYIVTHFPDEQKTLTIKGTVEPPDEGIDLYCKKDNWVGYFLYEEQSAFDALADVLDELYHIKGQDFNCYRYNYPVSDTCGQIPTKDLAPGTWICNARPNIEYGDMIMVKPEEDTWFQWNYSGNLPSDLDIPAPEYFDFEEQATYTTLVIELDTTMSNPDEIGAFVNDTCVGACTVNETDSVVVLSAYLDSRPGDSVTFQQHFTTQKSTNAKITDYLVLNNATNKKERWIIRTGSKQDIFIISFRDELIEEEQSSTNDFSVHVYPNPATSIVHIEYTLDSDSWVRIVLMDVMGKQVAEISGEHQPKGIHAHSLNVDHINDRRLEKGVYLIQVSAGGQSKVRKLIVN